MGLKATRLQVVKTEGVSFSLLLVIGGDMTIKTPVTLVICLRLFGNGIIIAGGIILERDNVEIGSLYRGDGFCIRPVCK